MKDTTTEIESRVSRIVGHRLKIHPIIFERDHVNVQSDVQDKPIDNWHQDSTPFVLVTILTQHADDSGGSLLVRARQEDGNILRAKLKYPGQAILMQGSHIWHCAQESAKGKRLTMVTSFYVDETKVYDSTSIRIALQYSPPLATLTQFVNHVLRRLVRCTRELGARVEKGDANPAPLLTVIRSETQKMLKSSLEIANLLSRGQRLQPGKKIESLDITSIPLTCLASSAWVMTKALAMFDEDTLTIETANLLISRAEHAEKKFMRAISSVHLRRDGNTGDVALVSSL